MTARLARRAAAVALVAALAGCSPPKPRLEVNLREVPTDVVIDKRQVGPEGAAPPDTTITTTTSVVDETPGGATTTTTTIAVQPPPPPVPGP